MIAPKPQPAPRREQRSGLVARENHDDAILKRFAEGADTFDIARGLKVKEAFVYNAIVRLRWMRR